MSKSPPARLAIVLALGASLSVRASTQAPPPNAGDVRQGSLVVAIDAGHGGAHPHEGAHGPRGLVEKNIALQVSQRIKALLEEAGATVVLTREDDADVALSTRAQIANESSADLFLSIHCNSMATPHDRAVTKGIETYFLSPDPTDAEAKLLAEMENGGPEAVRLPKSNDAVTGLLADLALGQARNDSAVLAQILHRFLIRQTGAQSRGVRQAPFLVLAGTKMPAALVEIGFISHPQEGRLLAKEKYQQRVATAVAAAVREFADKVLARRLFAPTAEERLARAEKRAASSAARAPGILRPSPRGASATASISLPVNASVPTGVSVPSSAAIPSRGSLPVSAVSLPVSAASLPVSAASLAVSAASLAPSAAAAEIADPLQAAPAEAIPAQPIPSQPIPSAIPAQQIPSAIPAQQILAPTVTMPAGPSEPTRPSTAAPRFPEDPSATMAPVAAVPQAR